MPTSKNDKPNTLSHAGKQPAARVASGAPRSVKPSASLSSRTPVQTTHKAVTKSTPETSSPNASKNASKKASKLEKPARPAISVKAALPPLKFAPASKSAPPAAKAAKPVPLKKAPAVPTKSAKTKLTEAADALLAAAPAKKKAGRPPKNPVEADALPAAGAKRGRKPKAAEPKSGDDLDMSDIEEDLVGEPVVETLEKVKPLRMKISKAKERALMKEFGLDETILSEEDMLKRRMRLKALIKLGKTRGYLTHGEISDHLPDKLIDAETLEAVIITLNDLGVAVYEQTPDAESLLITANAPAGSTEEEAEEAAEAALSTVDSEFGRTTDPVRMYMREMGTVELLTREGEIEIAKRIEGGLMRMMEAISESPATIAEIMRLGAEIDRKSVV